MKTVQRTWVRFKQFLYSTPRTPRNILYHRGRCWHAPCKNGERCGCRVARSPAAVTSPDREYNSKWSTSQSCGQHGSKHIEKFSTQLQQMQAMVQAIQMKYAAGPQKSHQDYVVRGYHSGHTNYCGQGGCGVKRRLNWRCGRGVRVNRDLTHYCCTHEICAHPSKDCRTPAEGNKLDAVWCKNVLVSERNWTWNVGLVPASESNVKEAKTYYTYELLCSSILYLPQHATIIAKSDSGASNNYWITEDMLVNTNLKDTCDGPTVQLPNNATMNATKTGSIPLSESLGTHEKKAHVFDGLHSASLIYLVQLCDNDCISILDKNDINILKNNMLILKGHRNKTDGLWVIPISRPLRHRSHAIIARDKTKIELIQYLHGCCFSPTSRNFLKAIKNLNLLTCTGLNNQYFLKNLPPGIFTALGRMY